MEQYTHRLARWLSGRQHTVTVAAADDLRREASAPAVSVVQTRAPEAAVIGLTLRHDSLRATYDAPEVEAWWHAWLQEHRPDVIHVQSGYLTGGPLLAAAARLSIPTLVTLHDYWFICARFTLQHPDGRCCTGPASSAKCAWCTHGDRRRVRVLDRASSGWASRLASALLGIGPVAAIAGYGEAIAEASRRRDVLRARLAGVHTVLSPSRFLAGQMVAAGVPAGRIAVHPVGLDPIAVAPRAPRTAPGLELVYLGQVARHKGVHVAVEAVRRSAHAGLRLTIRGGLDRDPGYVAELRQRAGDDPRIQFAGPYVAGQLGSILSDADAVVVPSIWYENYPTVILEAHAAGVPVVASRLGGMAEMVADDHDGLLFTVGDPRDLAAQLDRLVSDQALCARLSAGCRPPRTVDDEFTVLEARYAAASGAPTT